MSDVEHTLHRQSRAAASFVDGIKDMLGDDDELLQDMLEGETDLLNALQKAADAIDDETVLIDGITKRIGELQERKRLAKSRAVRIRSLIEQAMVMAGDMKTVRLPNMTITIKNRAPAPVVESEASIPARYWIEQPPPAPKLDKQKVAEDLSAGTAVPGCHLDNGSIQVQIRRK